MKLRVYFLAWLFLLPSVLAQEQGIVSSTLELIFGALGDELIVRFLFFIILTVILKELAQRTELLPGKTGGIVAVIVSLIGMRFMPASMLLTLKGFIVVVAALAFPYFILSMIFKNKKIALGISAALILVLALYLVFTPPTSVSSSGGYSRYGIEAYEDAKFFGINVPLHGLSDLISTVLYFFKAYAIYLGALAVLLLLIVFLRAQRGKISPGTKTIGEHLGDKGRAAKDKADARRAVDEQHKKKMKEIKYEADVKHEYAEKAARAAHERQEEAKRLEHERKIERERKGAELERKRIKAKKPGFPALGRYVLSKLFRRKQSGEEEKREEQVEEKQHDAHARAYQEAQRRAAEEERLRLAEERAEEKQIESARKALRRKYSWRKFKNLFKKDEEEEEIPVPKKEGAFSLLKSALRIESKERIADWKEERRLKQKAKEWQEQQRRMAEENANLVLKEAEEKQRQAAIMKEYEARMRDQRERELEAERERRELEKRKMNLLHFGPNQKQEEALKQRVEEQNRINEARQELRMRYAQRKGIPLRELEEEQRVEKYIPEKRGFLSKLKSALRLEQEERAREEEEQQRLELAAKQWREQQTLMAEHTAEQTIKEEEERKAAEVRKEFEERQRLEVERNREERRKLRDLARRKKRILNQK